MHIAVGKYRELPLKLKIVGIEVSSDLVEDIEDGMTLDNKNADCAVTIGHTLANHRTVLHATEERE